MRRLLFLYISAIVSISAQNCQSITSSDGLLIIDVQNSFLPQRTIPAYATPNYPIPAEDIVNGSISGGSVGVAGAEAIIDVLNTWIKAFVAGGGRVLASLDWHPPDSCSFCTHNTSICGPFGIEECGENGTASAECPPSLAYRCQDDVSVEDYEQGTYVQWPIHCQLGTFGARFDPYLNIPNNALVVKKGFNSTLDSYSAYGGRLSVEGWPFDQSDTVEQLNAQPSLKQVIEQNKIKRLWVTGIAIDYCVKNTILDSLGLNVDGPATKPSTLESVILVQAAARGVNSDDVEAALKLFTDSGATVMGPTYTDPTTTLQAFCMPASDSSSSSSNSWALPVVIVLAVLLVLSCVHALILHHRTHQPKVYQPGLLGDPRTE